MTAGMFEGNPYGGDKMKFNGGEGFGQAGIEAGDFSDRRRIKQAPADPIQPGKAASRTGNSFQ